MTQRQRDIYPQVKQTKPAHYVQRRADHKLKKQYLTNSQKSVLNLQWEEGEEMPTSYRHVQKPIQHERTRERITPRSHSYDSDRRPVQHRVYVQQQPEVRQQPVLVRTTVIPRRERSPEVKSKPPQYHYVDSHSTAPVYEERIEVVQPERTTRTVMRTPIIEEPHEVAPKPILYHLSDLSTTVPVHEQRIEVVQQHNQPERTTRTVTRTIQPEVAYNTDGYVVVSGRPEKTSKTVVKPAQPVGIYDKDNYVIVSGQPPSQPEKTSKTVLRRVQSAERPDADTYSTAPVSQRRRVVVQQPNEPARNGRMVVRRKVLENHHDDSYSSAPEQRPQVVVQRNESERTPRMVIRRKIPEKNHPDTHSTVPVHEQHTEVAPQYEAPRRPSRILIRKPQPEERLNERIVRVPRDTNARRVERRYVDSHEEEERIIDNYRQRGYVEA